MRIKGAHGNGVNVDRPEKDIFVSDLMKKYQSSVCNYGPLPHTEEPALVEFTRDSASRAWLVDGLETLSGAVVGRQPRSEIRDERGCLRGASFRKKYVRVRPMSEELGGTPSQNCPKYVRVRKLSEH